MNFDDELVSAWAELDPPPRASITEHNCDECEEIAEFFADKAWADCADVAALRYHNDALYLFAPSAYHYYLPAFIRATLLDPKAADLIPETIVSTLAHEFGNASRGRLELFSLPQRVVLALFLRALPALGLAEEEDVNTLAEVLHE